MEVVNLQRDDFLFRIGDNDDSIYVVQNGRVQVFIKDMVSKRDHGGYDLKIERERERERESDGEKER